MKLLIVEDQPSWQSYFRDYVLPGPDFEVLFVNDLSQAAVALLDDKQHFDALIVTNIFGVELVRALSVHLAFKEMKLIILTVEDYWRLEALIAGATLFQNKFDLKVLELRALLTLPP